MTAALAALLLIGVVAVAAQGSLTVLAHPPAAGAGATTGAGSWPALCGSGQARMDRMHLAYCARMEGVVLYVTHGPDRYETHLAVVGDFHVVIVDLDRPGAVPGVGSRIVAIGPMVRARDGQREIEAFKVRQA